MLPMYRDKYKVMYADMDSLIYLECDVYDIMKRGVSRFDTSAVDNIPLVNKKVPGLMKNENNGE